MWPMPAAVAPPPIGAGLDDDHAQPRCRAFGRAGGAHDAAAGNGYVVACAHVRADSVAEGVALIENQIGFGVDVGRSR